MRDEKFNLAQKLERITEHWSPRIVAELNGQHMKLAKIKGEFVWHAHEAEDEPFIAGSSTHLRAHETVLDLVRRRLLQKNNPY